MKKVIKVFVFFIFFALLIWPVYITLFYINFSSRLRSVLSVAFFVFEISLGLLCVVWSIAGTIKNRKTGSIILLIITCLSYLIYLGSLLNTYIIRIF